MSDSHTSIRSLWSYWSVDDDDDDVNHDDDDDGVDDGDGDDDDGDGDDQLCVQVEELEGCWRKLGEEVDF